MPMLGLTAAAAGMASCAAMAAEWSFTPNAQLTTQAQDNPRMLADGGDSETSLGAQAGFQMGRRTELLDFAAVAGAGYQRFQRDDSLDRSDQHLDLELSSQGENVSWNAHAGAARDSTQTSELGVTGVTQFNERHEGYNVSLAPNWQLSERVSLGSRIGWQLSRYPDPQTLLSDYRYSTASVNGAYALSDRASLSLVTSVGRYVTVDSRAVSSNASVSLQGRYAWSQLWSVTAGVGPSWVDANDTRERGLVYNVAIARQLENASVSLFASRSQQPSGFGVLTEADEAGLDFGMQISERLSGKVGAGLVRRRDALTAFRVDLQELRYVRADISLAWVVTPNLQLVGGVGSRTQRLGTLAGSGSAQNYQAQLSLSWTGNSHVY